MYLAVHTALFGIQSASSSTVLFHVLTMSRHWIQDCLGKCQIHSWWQYVLN
nr:MAG TPA: hypothetical protein [Caudoviricetes sp.]